MFLKLVITVLAAAAVVQVRRMEVLRDKPRVHPSFSSCFLDRYPTGKIT